MSTDKVLKAKALRQSAISQLSLIIDVAVSAQTDETHLNSFKIRHRSLSRIQKDFQKHHNTLLALLATKPDELKIEEKTGIDFAKRCHEIETIFYELFELPLEENGVLDSTIHPLCSHNQPASVRERTVLPKIQLPVFKGDITAFPTFNQTFSTLIHSSRTLSNIEKFNYLLSSLEGPPLNLISDIQVTHDNYHIAYNTLIERYNNKRLQAFTHWKSIEDCPRLTVENVTGLRNLMDTFSKNLAALQNLKFDIVRWDFILSYMLLDRLDPSTRKSFEQQHASNDVPKYDAIKVFLQKQCIALESVPPKQNLAVSPNVKFSKPPRNFQYPQSNNQNFKQQSAFLVNSQTNNLCFLCKGHHIIYRCPVFTSKSIQQRFQIIKNQKACVNCFATTHTVSRCSSVKRCRLCSQMHHTMLCFKQKVQSDNPSQNSSYLNSATNLQNNNIPDNSDNTVLPKTSQVGMLLNDHEVLLSTVLLRIRDDFNNWHTVKAILDSGAQSSFITRSCANKLSLPKYNIAMSLQGLESMCTTAKLGMHCVISSIYNENILFDLDAIILDKICDDVPAVSFSKENFAFASNLILADPNFAERSKIDILLGNDIFPYILQDGRLYNGPDKPVCVNTIFGWTLMGKTTFNPSNKVIKSFFTTSFSNCETLNNTLQKFWQVEEVPEVRVQSPEDEYCETYFLQTTTRTESGRYVVSLPFKVTVPDFGDTYNIALRRFLSLEKRFMQNNSFYKSYCDVINDYLNEGHMEIALKPSFSDVQNYFYIPHHAVFKKDSTTTPIRVVFDASISANNKLSLNNSLHTGPKLQRDLVNILLNFRLHKYVFTCDIKQMFRMILINPNDRAYQRILWRFSPNEPISEYQINVVTFGVVCSPYLAIRTLLKLADDYTDLPLASEILRSSTYVDDLTGGAATIEQMILIKNQILELLSRGGFEARKWASNCPDFLKTLPESYVINTDICFDLEDSIRNNTLKILGLQWDPISDAFCYQFSNINSECTKRTMLSELARTFDPVGYLTPLTIFIKLLIQMLWSLGLDWDEKPPPYIITKWNKFKSELPLLPALKINREINITDSISQELFGFCDSSERAFCGVVYIRALFSDNTYKTYLISAKSKVSPLKTISLARLELCAAVLLAKLMHYVIDVFSTRVNFNKIFAFTDSSVVLNWIKSSPHQWKTFVSNRVSYIQEKISPDLWYHVPSERNPADCGTRGLFLSELTGFCLWWNGPDFLMQTESNWSFSKFEVIKTGDVSHESRKFTITTFVSSHFIDLLFERFSSLSKIKRIIAYILRAINIFKNNKLKNTHPRTLTIHELHNAMLLLTKHVQSTCFATEINLLKNGKPVPKYLQKLKPFLDKDGYLRVGGRLFYSELPYDKKFPLLLPSNAKFTTLLIYDLHCTYLHCGIQTTQHIVLQNFWVISAKRVIRKVIHKCHTCWKVNPKPYQPPMGDLPKFRVTEFPKSFTNCGLDMCGPFPITIGKLRGAKVHKSYICLFICCSTKAVHLELVSDLSTEAFLAALRRFIARRGQVLNLYSDCGTGFIGGDKSLRKMFSQSANSETINWHFNPPSAPSMGGIWEANIKSVKSHLIRIVGSQILTYEELNTVIIQIEAVLNSRPLSPISSDPSDLTALTPGHFLTLKPLSALPDPDTTNLPLNRLTRWQLLQRLHRDFWNRWHREYLHTLQQRAKWHDPINTVMPGTLVVVKDENLPPLQWRLGRIVELFPGHDRVPRVAMVKTAKGILKRPLVKLCPLP